MQNPRWRPFKNRQGKELAGIPSFSRWQAGASRKVETQIRLAKFNFPDLISFCICTVHVYI